MNLKNVFLVVAIWLSVTNCFAKNSEPTFQGHTLGEWVDQINPEIPYLEPTPAHKAIRQIGTNGIPTILKWLSTGSTDRARNAYFILSEELAPAVPQLTQLALRLKEYKRFDDCVEALGCIGPAAVPGFNVLLTKGRPEVQFSAIEYLPMLHTNVVTLLPAIIKCVVGKNEEVGGKAVGILAGLEIPHSVSIPALTNALTTASTRGRLRIYQCFLFMRPPFGQPALEALPSIRAALKDPNPEIANTASNALEYLEPPKTK